MRGGERVCPSCRGVGWTTVAMYDPAPPGERTPADCSRCGGGGFIAARFGPAAGEEGGAQTD